MHHHKRNSTLHQVVSPQRPPSAPTPTAGYTQNPSTSIEQATPISSKLVCVAMDHHGHPPLHLPSPPQMPGHYHWLLHLPPAFWAHMNLYLDYHDILNLSMLSSQFRAVQVEKYLPWTARHAAVARCDREAAALVARRHGSQYCACYICFRMKPVDEFQRPSDAYTFARVIQRDAYTGRRIFEPVGEPLPGEVGNIVQPPSMPSSPAGMGMGMGIGLGIGIGMMGIGPSGSDLTRPVPGHMPVLQIHTSRGPVAIVSRSGWTPQAPGAEVGQIESLRRYCIDCALETRLLVPADVTTTQDNQRLWVCRCREAWPETVRRCDSCQMNQVFRD
ncbi:hypothetical protein CMQ_1140 [Grosmannia clavigera kw1407]|uniref:F-box domain-containing protein n=1 Tax=Grosmannia clavigera (strain kw1407 / UAMH 11150) TaxID=655863 RepID=F0XDH4_GROCL|nr:uncharacterized protein CMQ_1140 [Grosmannia clavigera kw1407]EFX04212.1 hypothetical protein CMQ_1140 [Grosmannia clavigera kw1407]